MKEIKLSSPIDADMLKKLKAGDRVLLSGVVYTARDAAHKRLCEAIAEGRELPFELKGQTIFYAGPAPAPENMPIGSVGPTTSYRMDAYAPTLIEQGLRAMIGKGDRNNAVAEACREHGAVYFAACGGVAALLASCVKKAEVIAYDDLGAESIRRLEICDMPLWVALDSKGNNIYHRK